MRVLICFLLITSFSYSQPVTPIMTISEDFKEKVQYIFTSLTRSTKSEEFVDAVLSDISKDKENYSAFRAVAKHTSRLGSLCGFRIDNNTFYAFGYRPLFKDKNDDLYAEVCIYKADFGAFILMKHDRVKMNKKVIGGEVCLSYVFNRMEINIIDKTQVINYVTVYPYTVSLPRNYK